MKITLCSYIFKICYMYEQFCTHLTYFKTQDRHVKWLLISLILFVQLASTWQDKENKETSHQTRPLPAQLLFCTHNAECFITRALLVPTQRNGWWRNRNPCPCEAIIFKTSKPLFKWTKLLEWQLINVTMSLMSCIRKNTKREVAGCH